MTLLALLVMRRLAGQEAEAAKESARLDASVTRLAVSAQLDQFWSRRVTEEALPLVRDVATGRLQPDDADVRERARAMEVALRDELVLGPHHAELVAALARVRAAGWQVTSTLTPADPEDSLAQAQRLLAVLGSPVRQGQPVTLSSGPDRAMALVLDPTAQQEEVWQRRLQELGGTAELDSAFARLGLPA